MVLYYMSYLGLSPQSGHLKVRKFAIVSMHGTQTPYTIVSGGRHIASSGVAIVSVVVGGFVWHYSGMVSEFFSCDAFIPPSSSRTFFRLTILVVSQTFSECR